MESTYTVSELSLVIARTVTRAFPDEVWVEGEIRDLSRSRNGHVYFTLVDPNASADPSPSLPVSLFASDKDAVNRVLIRSGAMRMTDGVHVRIRGRVNHYAPRATVQLRMTWIDTDFTVGKLAAARLALLRKLEASGDLARNARLGIPELPLRVGLVTSVGSAAHADFMTELQRSGFGFVVTVADARVQGAESAGSLTAALAAMAGTTVDVVAVVRGGGAQTDLAAFDTEAVARAIAAAPFPVFTGIGHEVDTTVADRVAAANFKTPTACAQRLVTMVAAAGTRIDAAHDRVARAVASALDRSGQRMSTASRRVAAGARMHVARHDAAVARAASVLSLRSVDGPDRTLLRLAALAQRSSAAADAAISLQSARLESHAARLGVGAVRAVANAGRLLDSLDAVRRAHAPERMLARGWSLTYGAGGRIVRSPADVTVGERIRSHVRDGDILSTVDEAEEGSTS